MLFEDLIYEARVVLEAVSPGKKKARYDARVKEFDRRGGYMVRHGDSKSGQRMMMVGRGDAISDKGFDREAGYATTKGKLRSNVRDSGEMIPGDAPKFPDPHPKASQRLDRARSRASKRQRQEVDKANQRAMDSFGAGR